MQLIFILGDKIKVLEEEKLINMDTVKQLKRLNYMRRCLVHNFGSDRLEDRREFIQLFNLIANTLSGQFELTPAEINEVRNLYAVTK